MPCRSNRPGSPTRSLPAGLRRAHARTVCAGVLRRHFFTTREEHLVHVRVALETLRHNKLYAKTSNCQFGCSSVSFLGHHPGTARRRWRVPSPRLRDPKVNPAGALVPAPSAKAAGRDTRAQGAAARPYLLDKPSRCTRTTPACSGCGNSAASVIIRRVGSTCGRIPVQWRAHLGPHPPGRLSHQEALLRRRRPGAAHGPRRARFGA